MNLVALNTACGHLGFTEVIDGRFQTTLIKERKQLDSALAPLLEKALYQTKRIVINIGPGNFTSLRVGLALSEGLSVTGNYSLFSVNTFMVMLFKYLNENKKKRKRILCTVGLTGGSIAFCHYKIIYNRGKYSIQPSEPDLVENISKNKLDCILDDTDIILSYNVNKEELKGIETIPDPDGVALAFIHSDNKMIKPFQPGQDDALYLRKSDAELKWVNSS